MIVKVILQSFDMADTSIVTAKQGDICDVLPDDHEFGRVERREHLIIKVDLGSSLTNRRQASLLRLEHWVDGRLTPPDADSAPAMLAKRRFRVPWSELIAKAAAKGVTVDMGRVLDKDDDYQPLEDVVFTVADLIHDKAKGGGLDLSDFTKLRQAVA